jgi:2,3-diketo-5-methylthio-1-phosphopentane phosphatase
MFFAIDFDGTVSLRDSVDALLERHAPANWHTIEADWAEGRITAQACMRAQIGLITASERQLQHFFESIRLDPAFPDFLAHVQSFSHLAIISDGIGRAIHMALEVAGLPGVPVYANRLTFDGKAWDLEFPNADAGCLVGSGTCKCAVARRLAAPLGGPLILIGDGRSDACLASRADYVFAKDSLARHCEAEAIPYTEFQTFADVLGVVRGWPTRHGRPVLLDA